MGFSIKKIGSKISNTAKSVTKPIAKTIAPINNKLIKPAVKAIAPLAKQAVNVATAPLAIASNMAGMAKKASSSPFTMILIGGGVLVGAMVILPMLKK
jgi:hypothetical protein